MSKRCIVALAAATLSIAASGARHDTVVMSRAWVRALPPGQATTAAYMTIRNAGAGPAIVVGARTGIADKVEIHTSRNIDGYVRMEQLEQVELAAGQSLELAPGGTHLMLLGLDRMPMPGENVPLCLQLAGGDEVCTVAEVRKTAAAGHAHHHHH